MSSAKAVSLRVRPYKIAHVCFEVGGILEPLVIPQDIRKNLGEVAEIAQLGSVVKAFDFAAFYAMLGGRATAGTDGSRLLYDFPIIDQVVAPFALGALRREPLKAALNNAINSRQNAYFAKYGNLTGTNGIIARMNQAYSPAYAAPPNTPLSKPQYLSELVNVAEVQFQALSGAYQADGTPQVVRHTTSQLTGDTTGYGYAATSGQNSTISANAGSNDGALPNPPTPPGPWAPPAWPPPAPRPPSALQETWSTGWRNTTGGVMTAGIEEALSYQQTSDADKSHEEQTIVNTDYGYRTPNLEAQAQYIRAQISLIDQQFAQYMQGQNLPNLATVFQNELVSIDGNVFRLQIGYLNSILMSPIAGLVTGVYKHPGEAVRAGEPVYRIEDNQTVYLVATIIYRGPIVVSPLPPPSTPLPNSTLSVTTSLYGSTTPATLTGSVVSARGHGKDDKWDVVVLCKNPLDASNNRTFPLGYQFDFDDTPVVTIT